MIDRLHAKSALRFLDLEISGPVELIPGVFCEAANAHTEGSMNVHVHTAEGVATICGDVLYDINDQVVEPFRENNDGEPRTTGNHGTSKRAEKAARIGAILDELYPQPPIPLTHRDPFTLLVAVAMTAVLRRRANDLAGRRATEAVVSA